jgi:hypothetical protein
MEEAMVKYLMAIAAVSILCMGCSMSTEKCLGKEGFKNCEDFRAAAKKAVGNDEVYRFLTIAKKCHCQE